MLLWHFPSWGKWTIVRLHSLSTSPYITSQQFIRNCCCSVFSSSKCCTVNRQPTNPYLQFTQYLPLSPVHFMESMLSECCPRYFNCWYWLCKYAVDTVSYTFCATIHPYFDMCCTSVVRYGHLVAVCVQLWMGYTDVRRRIFWTK
jgi:hypothetical protein